MTQQEIDETLGNIKDTLVIELRLMGCLLTPSLQYDVLADTIDKMNISFIQKLDNAYELGKSSESLEHKVDNTFTPREVIINRVSDGLGYKSNDHKYIGKAYHRVVTLVDSITSNIFLTDFYIPEFKDQNNDYIRNGFLIVSSGNFREIS